MKQVKIPTDYNPFVVVVNGVVYSYKAGSTQNVPDDVAKVIDNYNNLKPKEGNPDGGTLPYIDKSDNGKVLKANDGNWHKGDAEKGTEVIANPTLAGTEAALTGLQVDGTKYKVGGMDNPMTAAGDIIIGGTDGEPEKLAKGTVGQFLATGDEDKPEWTDLPTQAESLSYLTTAPSADNTSGIKIVVLSQEPATKYNGYLYLITGA